MIRSSQLSPIGMPDRKTGRYITGAPVTGAPVTGVSVTGAPKSFYRPIPVPIHPSIAMEYGGLGFSFGKIFRQITSLPKRALGLTKAVVTTPLRVGQALIMGKPVRPILKDTERELRRSGALPGDTRKVLAKASPVISAIGSVLSFTPLAPLGLALTAAGAAIGAGVKIQAAKQAKRVSGQQTEYLQTQYNEVYKNYVRDTTGKGSTPIDKTTFDRLVNESMYGPTQNLIPAVANANPDFTGPPQISDGRILPQIPKKTDTAGFPVALALTALLSSK